jgi:hypothetical protein
MRNRMRLDFLDENYPLIVEACLKNKHRTGYLRLYSDENFDLIESSVVFIEGDFNKEEFNEIDLNRGKSSSHPVIKRIRSRETFYFSILFFGESGNNLLKVREEFYPYPEEPTTNSL